MDYLNDNELTDAEKLKKYFEDTGKIKAQDEYGSQLNDIALSQGFNALGKAIAGEDVSGAAQEAQQMRKAARDATIGKYEADRKMAMENFDVGNKIKQRSMDMDMAAKEADPNSYESSLARELAKKMGMSSDAVNGMTAQRFKQLSPVLQKMYEVDQNKLSRQMMMQERAQMKADELARKNSPEAKREKLSGSDKARFDNALMVLKGIDQMGQALDAGQNTFSLVGDNDYTSASRNATEAYGRMQSGGAINKEEEKRFEAALPRASDSKEMQRKKLLNQRDEMISRLKTLGFTPQEIGYQPTDFSYGSKQQSKPKTIIQNGHTYTLNPATGQYE